MPDLQSGGVRYTSDATRAKHKALMRELIARLAAEGIKLTLYKFAASGSIYLRFEDRRMGQVRIGNHDEYAHLGYRWQIRPGVPVPRVDRTKAHERYFYGAAHLRKAVAHMASYHARLGLVPTTIKPIDIHTE